MFNQFAKTLRVIPEFVGFKQVSRETRSNIVEAFDCRFAGTGGEIGAPIDGRSDDLKYKALFEETVSYVEGNLIVKMLEDFWLHSGRTSKKIDVYQPDYGLLYFVAGPQQDPSKKEASGGLGPE